MARGAFRDQPGDDPIVPFSFLTDGLERAQVACYQLYTTQPCTSSSASNVARSPLFNGQIQGIGPRYCPSIEDKVIRFAEQGAPPAVPRARRAGRGRDLRERLFDEPSGGCPARDGARAARARARRDDAPGLRRRIRLRAADRAAGDARDQASATALPRRPDQRHLRLRGSRRPGTDGRGQCRACAAGAAGVRARPRRGLYWRHGGRPGDEGLPRALPDVHLARGAAPGCSGSTTRTSGSHKRAGSAGLVDDCRWERFVARRERLERNRSLWRRPRCNARSPARGCRQSSG